MEASALPASVGLPRTRIALGASLLRIRSDEQLVSGFRAGSEEAFRVIHDRYRARMLAYARQMLGGSCEDPEDAVQEIFVRAYAGLRASNRDLALRAWLYRIAHNRCIDQLRRPHPPTLEAMEATNPPMHDPVTKAEQREELRRLIADVQRLPEQQRSALLMRELAGMTYSDVAGALGVSVPAVKSLLVRARVGLAQASEARDASCAEIREDLILAHDRGVRTSGLARRHMRDCQSCRQFRSEVRGVSRQLAALAPTLGPLGVIANLLGLGGSAGGGAAASGGGAAAASGAAGTGAATSGSLLATGAGHVVTLLAAAVVTAGGAVELQRTLAASASVPGRTHHQIVRPFKPVVVAPSDSAANPFMGRSSAKDPAAVAPGLAPAAAARPPAPSPSSLTTGDQDSHGTGAEPTKSMPISELLDPDNMSYESGPSSASSSTGSGSTTSGSGSGSGTTTSTGSGTSGSTTTGTGTSTSPTGTSGTGSTTTPTSGTGTGTGTGGSTGSGGPAASGTGSGTTGNPATGSAGGAGASGSGGSSSSGGASTTPSSV